MIVLHVAFFNNLPTQHLHKFQHPGVEDQGNEGHLGKDLQLGLVQDVGGDGC